ncbi:MAG: hypothetical protein ABI556_16285, partial [Gemmatimonadales bacterium]
MTQRPVERVADALLFEGYMLYPYRPSAVKNRQRFNFGVIYPCDSGISESEGKDAYLMQTECLIEGDVRTVLEVKVRFLQLVERTVEGNADIPPWQEAIERAVTLAPVTIGEMVAGAVRQTFTYEAAETRDRDPDPGMGVGGSIIRRQRTIEGAIEVTSTEAVPGLFKVRVQIHNVSACEDTRGATRDEFLLRSFVSAHTILTVADGAFVSLLDPPVELRGFAASCHGVRSWPVLVGENGERDTMLSSPIIIYDYPAIAPESAGDLFDGTEIDEILSLRILTMTDEEKREMRQSDER